MAEEFWLGDLNYFSLAIEFKIFAWGSQNGELRPGELGSWGWGNRWALAGGSRAGVTQPGVALCFGFHGSGFAGLGFEQ